MHLICFSDNLSQAVQYNYHKCSINIMVNVPTIQTLCMNEKTLKFVESPHTLRKHPHIMYTPSFTFLYSRKGEMRGTQNEGLFSGLD